MILMMSYRTRLAEGVQQISQLDLNKLVLKKPCIFILKKRRLSGCWGHLNASQYPASMSNL